MTTDHALEPHAPDPAAEGRPPEHYGNGDTWADEGPWYVPVELRPYYAVAEPSDQNLKMYVHNGVHVPEEQTGERVRVIDPGDATRPPTTVTEEYTVDTLVHRHGAEYFPAWLHGERLTRAVRDKKAVDDQREREAAYPVCVQCGVKSPAVQQHRVPNTHSVDYNRRVLVVSCPGCRPILSAYAERELVQRAADRKLTDGRPMGDVAARVIRNLLDGAP